MTLFSHPFIRAAGASAVSVGKAKGAASNSEGIGVTALKDGGYAIVWSHLPDGKGREIWTRAYGADGAAEGAAQKASVKAAFPSGTPLDQYWPQVTAAGDGFMVSWSIVEYNGGYNTGRNIMARMFDAAAQPLGPAFTAALAYNSDGSVRTGSWEVYQSMATLSDGRVLMAFDNEGQVGLKLFAADGTEVLGAWQGNSGNIVTYYPDPKVAALKDGRFVAVWNDHSGIDGDDRAVVGRIFEADGAPEGTEFVLTEQAKSIQSAPNVVALSDGGFVATWRTYIDPATEAYSPHVAGRIFNADGSARGGTFNLRPDHPESYGSTVVQMVALDDGGFLALYGLSTAKYGNIYGDHDVYLRRFDAKGKILGPEMRVNPEKFDATTGRLLNDGDQVNLHGAALDDDRVALVWTDIATGRAMRRVIEVSDVNAQGTSGEDFITLTGTGKARALGKGHDALAGSGGNDTVTGGAGNDTIAGAAGKDRLSGGIGADRIDGEAGADRISGDAGKDRLSGGAGADTLLGGTEGDLLTGGAGADVLTGGAGADRFIFAEASDSTTGKGRDLITDFRAGIDKIDLSALDLAFIGRQGFHGTAGELRFGVVKGEGLLQADLDGDGAADLVIRLDGVTKFAEGDLIL